MSEQAVDRGLAAARGGGRVGLVVATLLAGLALSGGGALALTPDKDEKDKLKACERKLCDIVLSKSDKGGDYACTLGKTWSQSAIETGAKKSSVSWTFGDARCSVDVGLSRAVIVSAMAKPGFTIEAPEQRITCEVERSGEKKPINAVVAPRIEFKDGKAEKAWINLKSIDAPGDIKALASTLTKLHDKAGLFHGGTIKSINRLLHKTCAEEYGAKK